VPEGSENPEGWERPSGPPYPRPPGGFLDTQERVRRSHGQRWKNPRGDRLWEWDPQHGHVEGYDRRGNHVGVFDAMTGERIAPAKKGRDIDV
jgi:hypothetical protein